MKSKEICCIGAGYVGGPTMAVIAHNCPDYNITVVDSNEKRIAEWNGPENSLPIYEPGLKEIIRNVRKKNLIFSNDVEKSINKADIIFIAVNTPTKSHGEGKGMAADLTNIEKCARLIAKSSSSNKIIVEKSTAPVGTGKKIKSVLNSENSKIKFQIVSNPEFLAEGTAINDLMNPDRVLIGGEESEEGDKAVNTIANIYREWLPENKIILTNLWSSELSKLASNAFLAQRISSINSLSALCEKSGADIDEVSSAVGMDSRIGDKFLKVSIGFGGSCFKKDILNLVYLCRHYSLDEVAEYWLQILKINDFQKTRFSENVINELDNNVKNKIISILGWAFKKDTNDSRESGAIDISANLLTAGASLNIYDPMVSKSSIINDLTELWRTQEVDENIIQSRLKRVKLSNNIDESLYNSSCICVLTEWDEFFNYNWEKTKNRPEIIFDGRDFLDTNKLKKIFKKVISLGK